MSCTRAKSHIIPAADKCGRTASRVFIWTSRQSSSHGFDGRKVTARLALDGGVGTPRPKGKHCWEISLSKRGAAAWHPYSLFWVAWCIWEPTVRLPRGVSVGVGVVQQLILYRCSNARRGISTACRPQRYAARKKKKNHQNLPGLYVLSTGMWISKSCNTNKGNMAEWENVMQVCFFFRTALHIVIYNPIDLTATTVWWLIFMTY